VKIQEAAHRKCGECGAYREIIREELYGCDNCRKVIDLSRRDSDYLDVGIHQKGNNVPTKRMEFCSWACVKAKLKSIKSNYFVSLPFLHYDSKQKGLRAQDFFRAFGVKR